MSYRTILADRSCHARGKEPSVVESVLCTAPVASLRSRVADGPPPHRDRSSCCRQRTQCQSKCSLLTDRKRDRHKTVLKSPRQTVALPFVCSSSLGQSRCIKAVIYCDGDFIRRHPLPSSLANDGRIFNAHGLHAQVSRYDSCRRWSRARLYSGRLGGKRVQRQF